MNVTTDRLLKLRDNARLERSTVLEHRVRMGEDPARAYEETPEVDDFVVAELRDELLEERGRLAEFRLAQLAASGGGSEAAIHRSNVDRIEFELLREIAESVPELTVAVWRRAARLDVGGAGA